MKPEGVKSDTLNRLGSERALVRGDLLGVIVAIAAVDPLVARQRGGMQLAFWRRDQIEISAAVALCIGYNAPTT